jgi:hypothetical protein
MKQIISMLSLALALGFLAAGCDLIGEDAHWTATLPALPIAWRETFPNAQADFIVVGADGEAMHSGVDLAAGTFPVLLRKERNSLVLLYPKAGADRLRPFGAIFPIGGDLATQTIPLTVAGGFVAERLHNLARQGFPIQYFNSERLLDFLAEKGGDPWDFDPELIERKLAEVNFSIYAIKKLGARQVSLPVPAGAWFSESPTAPVWETDGSVPLVIPELAYGYHTLFRQGGGERVYVSVSARDVIVLGP